MTIASESIYHEYYDDLKIVDIVDFKSKVLEPKILELQEYFDKNIEYSIFNAGVMEINSNNYPIILELEDNKLIIYFNDISEDLLITSDKVTVKNISVYYDEDCQYNNFNEYDTSLISVDYDSIQECLSTQKDCSYMEKYSYYIYLKVVFEIK